MYTPDKKVLYYLPVVVAFILLLVFSLLLITIILYQYKYKISKDYLVGSWIDPYDNMYVITRDKIEIFMENGNYYSNQIDICRKYMSLSNNIFILKGDDREFKCVCYPDSGHLDLYMNGVYVSALGKNTMIELNNLAKDDDSDKKRKLQSLFK